jgi:hypothetical protein
MTNPARIMVLIVAPPASRMRRALMTDRGMATTLISAVRHSNRNAPSMRIIRMAPIRNARLRLLMDVSMNVAGRKMLESMPTPGRPGFSCSRASSTPLVTSRVLAHGSFSTMSMSPSPSLMTASPMSGWWSRTRSATSLRRTCFPLRRATETWARSSAWMKCGTCCTLYRLVSVSTHPPVGMKVPSE